MRVKKVANSASKWFGGTLLRHLVRQACMLRNVIANFDAV